VLGRHAREQARRQSKARSVDGEYFSHISVSASSKPGIRTDDARAVQECVTWPERARCFVEHALDVGLDAISLAARQALPPDFLDRLDTLAAALAFVL